MTDLLCEFVDLMKDLRAWTTMTPRCMVSKLAHESAMAILRMRINDIEELILSMELWEYQECSMFERHNIADSGLLHVTFMVNRTRVSISKGKILNRVRIA